MEPERRNYCTYCDDYGHDALDHKESTNIHYLGPMCECGHHEYDHHRSWFSNGYKLVEECEWWGYNETGGAELTADGSWKEHCQRFREAK